MRAAMAERDTKVGDLCKELGVTRQTLYRFVGPNGELRPDGAKLLKSKAQNVSYAPGGVWRATSCRAGHRCDRAPAPMKALQLFARESARARIPPARRISRTPACRWRSWCRCWPLGL